MEKLKRVRIGSVDLGKMKPGEFRRLDPKEVDQEKGGRERSLHVESSAAF